MSPRNGDAPRGYFEYVVPPLEGLWWFGDDNSMDVIDKSGFYWTAMIRQPEFVADEVFSRAAGTVSRKKPGADVSKAKLARYTEGLCVQCMHIGSYDEEPATIEKMMGYIEKNGLVCDLSDTRGHHEIYLSDPTKVEVSKRKTVLRYPVRRA
jgi:hypothetical protein